MINIDGSHGEGGGQIVRTALALSTVLQMPVRIENIRKGRNEPGLKAQHLTCIKALQKLCNAKIDGDVLGSDFLLYVPGKVTARNVEVDIGTAGSITLLLQSLLLPCFFANHATTLKIKGGTSGKWQMPFDYLENVLLPHLRRYADIKAILKRRGYYPKGGGEIEIKIKPLFNLETRKNAFPLSLLSQGTLAQIKGVSHASKDLQEKQVAERQANAAKSLFVDYRCNIDIRDEYCDTLNTGSGIVLWAKFANDFEETEFNPVTLGADALGELRKSAEDVGSEAAKMLINEINSKAPVDKYLADNLVPFIAMFGGKIRVSEITNHTLSNIYSAESFLGKKFEVNEKEKIIFSHE